VDSEIKHDHVVRYTNKTLTLSGVQFWIYDKSTLEVKAKFDSNLRLLKENKILHIPDCLFINLGDA
jgi:hypothetical protein